MRPALCRVHGQITAPRHTAAALCCAHGRKHTRTHSPQRHYRALCFDLSRGIAAGGLTQRRNVTAPHSARDTQRPQHTHTAQRTAWTHSPPRDRRTAHSAQHSARGSRSQRTQRPRPRPAHACTRVLDTRAHTRARHVRARAHARARVLAILATTRRDNLGPRPIRVRCGRWRVGAWAGAGSVI